MRAAPGILVLLAIATAASTAGSEVDELLGKTRAKVLDSAHRLPRYTCVETISRAQYLSPAGGPPSCSALRAPHRQGSLALRDKLRLDVAVVNGGEMFSWAGAGKFETHDVYKLVGGGASGSGDFGSFLEAVFGMPFQTFHYQGLQNDYAVFQYAVPLLKSTYSYHDENNGPTKRIGFHGTVSIDPSDADLQQLVVETDEFDASDRACQVDHVMDYQRVKIGSGDFLLPEVSTMKAYFRNGAETLNETRYSNCREYVGESTIRFDDVDPAAAPAAASKNNIQPLPPKTRMDITLAGTIDGEVAAAGDEVTGMGKFAHENDRVHGRILRLAQFTTPKPHWILAVRFDSIERGGTAQPLSLKSLDYKVKSPFPDLPPDAGVFNFDGDAKIAFRSAWETR